MGNTPLSKNHKKTVYYDGSCPMCTNIMERINASVKREQFALTDITEGTLPKNTTQEAVAKEIHVVDAEGKTHKNAEAILKILEEYPRWKLFVKFGRLPGIKYLLSLGYNFVAANRHFLFGPASRIYWLKVVLLLGLFSGLLLSLKLWHSSRLYPLTPLIGDLPPLPAFLDWIALGLLFGSLAGAALSSKPRFFLLTTVAVMSGLIFLDQQRLQPWVYQYTVMLAVLGLFSWKFEDFLGRASVLNTCRFMVASIYFYSGLQKLNGEFIHTVFPWVIAPLAELFSHSTQTLLLNLGILVPFLQISIGVGLLTKKFRSLAVGLTGIMCLFVLTTLGPWGHNWNSVVWPWNITIFLTSLLLFARTPQVAMQDILYVKNSLVHKLVLCIFGFLPLLSFFNLWDSYLSWSLYSGTTNQATITLSKETEAKLPSPLRALTSTQDTENYTLSVSSWAFAELNVPPYPEARVLKNVAQSICEMSDSALETSLTLHGRLSWFHPDQPSSLSCSELKHAQ